MQVDDDATSSRAGLVFAHRAFEDRLVQFAVAEVAKSGKLPSDDAIRARAREVAGHTTTTTTPADDAVLLERFKTMVVERVKAVLGGVDDGGATGSYGRVPVDRGMDAIDPGLLPALGPLGGEREIEVQVAISERRLDEIITEALG